MESKIMSSAQATGSVQGSVPMVLPCTQSFIGLVKCQKLGNSKSIIGKISKSRERKRKRNKRMKLDDRYRSKIT